MSEEIKKLYEQLSQEDKDLLLQIIISLING